MTDGADGGRSLKDWFTEMFTRMTEVGTAATLVGAAVFAFFTQPLMRFVDPDRAYAAAVTFFLGLLLVTFSRKPTLSMGSAAVGSAVVFASMVMFASLLDDASDTSTRNDRRCLTIERAMLGIDSKQEDMADVFTALACRPQTDRTVQLPRVTVPAEAKPSEADPRAPPSDIFGL